MSNQSTSVLVIDDDTTNLLLLKSVLRGPHADPPHFILTSAQRMDEAIALLGKKHFDVVLLHLGLPDIRGIGAFIHLQSEYPAVPIVILAGVHDREVAMQAVKLGAQDFMLKGDLDHRSAEHRLRYAIERKRSQHSLASSEAGYRRLFETARDGIFILNAQSGQVTDANPYLEELLGFTKAEMVGKRLWEMAPFRDKEANKAAFRTLQEIGFIRYEHLQLATKAGPFVDVEFISNVYDVGDTRVIQCNIRDITYRKHTDALEKESKRFLQSTLDALSPHIAVLDGAGRVTAVNLAWQSFATQNNGPAATCGVGANYIRVCDEATGAWSTGALAMAKGIRDVLTGERTSFSHEYPCHAPHEDRWFNVCVTRLAGEGPAHVAIAHENISSRKEAAGALREANEHLEARVEARTAELARSNNALMLQVGERESAETKLRVRARQQEAVAELGRQALANLDLDALMNNATRLVKETLDVELSTILEKIDGGDSLRIRSGAGANLEALGKNIPGNGKSQAGYVLKLGEPIIVRDLRTEVRFEPSLAMLDMGITSGITVALGDVDRPYGTLGAHSTQTRIFTQDDVHFLQSVANVLAAALEQRNINGLLETENTERRTALVELHKVSEGLKVAKEEAEMAREIADEANLAKSEFLSRMSHELRTPLNAILGFGQILASQDLNTRTQESVAYILKGGRHLLDLVNEVLDIARVEAGHIELSLEPNDLDELVPEASALLRPLAAARNIRLTDNTSSFPGIHVLADRQRLKQVLINLLSNAIKYNRDDGEVEVLCRRGIPGRVLITVRDTGLGIAPNDIKKLFKPFERLSASNTEVEGTGLGLVLSERLVIAMNGTLQAESVLGSGSKFTVDLPEAISVLAGISAVLLPSLPVKTNSRGKGTFTVLCIEDNPSNLRLIEVILESREEISLLFAIQGSVGIDLARQHKPNLILLDLNLPDLSGGEVLSRLQQSPTTCGIPVVVVSADATPKQIEKLMATGAMAYLTKPLDVQQFLETIDKFLWTSHDETQATMI